jgi:branched-chain amino acid transport system permease protein
MLLNYAGIGYWPALVVAPIVVGALGILIERNLIAQLGNRSQNRSFVLLGSGFVAFLILLYVLQRSPTEAFVGAIVVGLASATAFGYFRPDEPSTEHVDHLYGLLLTFGLALILQGLFRNQYGVSGLPYGIPSQLTGGQNLGFMFMPNYRGWVVIASAIVCLATWFIIEKTKLGAYLRAATENATLVGAFGVNVPRMITLTYGFGVGLAAFAGVLAAPIYSVNPNMGADIIIVVFAVVVIGGMGSILGSILTGFALGIVEGLTKVFWPEASATVIFVIMAIVLLARPAGLFGRA